MAAHEPLCIQLMGGFRVTRGEQTLLDDCSRQRRALAIIKLLALVPSHRLHREQVMETLWPDLALNSAGNNLNYTVHTARRLLGGVDGDSSLFLVREGDILALGPPELVRVDIHEFKAAATLAVSRNIPAGFKNAIALYTGDLLPADRYEDWTVERRAHLQHLYLDMLRGLAHVTAEFLDFEGATNALQVVLDVEPADEDVHAQLMRLYALNGQRSKALAQYQRLKVVLRRELDAEPDSATLDLYQAIVQRHFPATGRSIRSSPPGSQPVSSPGRPLRKKRRSKPTPLAVGRAHEEAVLRERLGDDGTSGGGARQSRSGS